MKLIKPTTYYTHISHTPQIKKKEKKKGTRKQIFISRSHFASQVRESIAGRRKKKSLQILKAH